MKVISVNHSQKHPASKDAAFLVQKICTHFLSRRVRNRKELKLKKELTVVFLNEAKMKKINGDYRGKNKSTDILSFESADPNSLGELLLCMPVLQRQAEKQGHPLRHEMAYMLVHGVLHLLGYDHELSRAEEKLMLRLQENCFRNLGLVQTK